MATATVVSTFTEGGCACMAVRVDGDSTNGRACEYIGRVLIDDVWRDLDAAGKRAALVAAAKSARDARKGVPPAAPSITGSVTV